MIIFKCWCSKALCAFFHHLTQRPKSQKEITGFFCYDYNPQVSFVCMLIHKLIVKA